MKQGDILQLHFNLTLEYDIRKAQDNQEGFELNETHHLLDYVGDINLLRKKVS
jgi:hypothetical protein